ncbi:MAG: hypothetical protein SFZ24_09140 [Planctomycetota bacterium]|nr:hypothetical protein [Planctomycetota bacterium]
MACLSAMQSGLLLIESPTMLAASFPTSQVMLAVVLLAGGVALLAMPKLRDRLLPSRHRGAAESVAARAERARKAAAELAQIEQVARDAREAIRLGCQQLDARLERLESLVRRVDEIAASSVPMQEPPRVILRAVSPAAAPAAPARVPVAAGAAAAMDGGFHGAGPHRPAHEEPEDPMIRRAWELAQAGRSARDIAAELGEHIGKVELMLALRRA